MSDSINLGTGMVTLAADSSGLEASVSAAVTKVKTLGPAGAEVGKQMSDGFKQAGKEAENFTSKAEKAAGGMASSIQRAVSESQRAIAELQSASKGDRPYFESLLAIKNIDAGPMRSLLSQLDDYKSSLSVAATKEREFAASDAFLAKHESAKKLARDSEYVNAYAAALDRAEAKEREFAASKLSVAAAQEKELAASSSFAAQHEAARRSVRESEYARTFAPVIENETRVSGQSAFLRSLEQETVAIGKTRSELVALQAAKLGISDKAAPYIAQLKAIETGHHGTAMSARQLAYAMRGVPAQFTDIFTSIAAGQSPMMVFLQQGGQLKDMFGGAGAAALALSRYVYSLVTPYSLAAAAAASLAVAWNMGDQEARDLAKSLILTGNAAGTSVWQMQEMSSRVAQATGATVGYVSDVMGQVAATGKIPASVMGEVTESIVKMSRVGGGSIESLVKDFASIAGDPVKAIEKLDEKHNFLTVSIYDQIKALRDQGKEYEATVAAMEAFSGAGKGMADKLKENLGSIESGWNAVKGAAKAAWDSMLDIGRGMSPERIELLKMIAAGDRGGAMLKGARMGDVLAPDEEIRAMLAVDAATKEQAASKAAETAASNRAKSAYLDLSNASEKHLDPLIKKQRDQLVLAEKYRVALSASNLTAAERNKIEAAYLSAASGSAQDGSKELASTKSAKEAKTPRQIQDAYLQKQLHGKDYELDAVKESEKHARELAESGRYIKDLNEKFGRENSSFSDGLQIMSESQSKLNAELRKVDDSAAQVENRLARMFGDGKLSAEEYAAKLTELNDITFNQINNVTALYGEQDRLNSSWSVGAERAISRYGDSAKNVAGTVEGAFTSGFKTMEDAMVSFTTNTKVSYSGMAKSILADLQRIYAKQLVMGMVKMVTGVAGAYFGGAGSGYGQTSAQAAVGADINSAGMGGFAKGGVFNSPSLHNYANQIHDTPKFFQFAKGGVFAEAGPEAIMPLSRDSSGRLGVKAQGGGDSSPISISVGITIASDGSSKQESGQSDGSGSAKALGEMVANACRQVIVQEMRSGGMLQKVAG